MKNMYLLKSEKDLAAYMKVLQYVNGNIQEESVPEDINCMF